MIVLSRNAIRVVTFLYAGVLAVVSLLPSGTGVLGGWDRSITPALQNVLHLPAYGLLFVLALLCWGKAACAGPAAMSVAALACGVFGAALEFAQAFIPGRMGSVLDMLLNFAGVGLGLLTVILHRRATRGCDAPPAS